MASALVEETSVPAATPSSPPQLLTFGDHRPPTQIPRWIVLLGALVAQAVLTRAMMSYPRLGLAQGVLLLILAGYTVLRRDVVTAVCVLAYLPNAEIVWRQTRSPLPYQFAPYLAIAISTLVVITALPVLTKATRVALFYFALLLPSIVVTISVAGG